MNLFQWSYGLVDPTVGGGGGGGGLTSFNGRTDPDAVPETGDYSSDQITEVAWLPPSVTFPFVQNFDTLDSSALRMYQLATKLIVVAGKVSGNLLGDTSDPTIWVNLPDLTSGGKNVVHAQTGTCSAMVSGVVYGGVAVALRLPPLPLPATVINGFSLTLPSSVGVLSGPCDVYVTLPLSLE